MKRFFLLCLFVLGGVSAIASDLPQSAEEVAFHKLSLRIKENQMKGKDLKKLGLVDDSERPFDIDYDGFTYSIEFRNKSAVAFDDLEIECRFFYTEAESGRSSSLGGNTNLRDAVIKCQREEAKCSVRASGQYKMETRSFIIQSWLLPGGWYFDDGTPNKKESKEIGLWVRVFYTTPDGQKLQRDFCEPSSLSSRVTWDGKSI